jgi:hypothetical protein
MNLHTTPEASKLTGIPESTIRSWLSRHSQAFEIGIHLIIEDSGRKMWTDAGIELLRSRATQNATVNVADSDAVDVLDELLDHDSEILADEYYRQLPGRLLSKIRGRKQAQHASYRTAVATVVEQGSDHLLLKPYQPLLLGGADE